MPQQNPLTGNHVAQQLKKYFRANGIHYITLHTQVIANDCRNKNFPPLVFQFKPQSNFVRIYNILQIGAFHYYETTTVTQLFKNLLQDKILYPNQLPL